MTRPLSDTVDPYDHLAHPKLTPVPESPWLGRTVRGPYRSRSTVVRVYSTPFSVDVALCLHQKDVFDTLRLEVVDMLSTPERPAAQRAAYHANYRRLLRLYGLVNDGKATKRTHLAIRRRSAFYELFRTAKVYIEAALLEQVRTGDRMVTAHGIQVTVTDPEAGREALWGWRSHMDVKLTPQFESFASTWNWPDGKHRWFVSHEGWGLLPTLGIV